MTGIATRRGIYGKLAGDTTLNNLLATPPTGYSKSIFYQVAPEGAGYPFVVFQKQAGTPTYAFALPTALDTEVWQVKGVDRNTTPDIADAIAARLAALLTDGALSIAGATQLYLRRDSDVDYVEIDGGDQYRHAGSLYRLIVT